MLCPLLVSSFQECDISSVPVMDFSSDEELPQIYQPSRSKAKTSPNQSCSQQQVSTFKNSLHVSITIDSDDDDIEITRTQGPLKKSERVNHSISDSSEDELNLPSLRDRIQSSEFSSLSKTNTYLKQNNPLETKSYSNEFQSRYLNSKNISDEGETQESEKTDFSDSQSTRSFDSRSESQSTISLSQSSGCSVGDPTKKKRTKEEIATSKREAEVSVFDGMEFLFHIACTLLRVN